jgi:hypothetical protein
MEEFYAKHGVQHKAELLERVKSDPILAINVINELLDEKFPAEVKAEEVPAEETHE